MTKDRTSTDDRFKKLLAEELTHEEGIFGKTEILDEIKAEAEAAQKAEEEKKEGDAAGEDGEANDAEE